MCLSRRKTVPTTPRQIQVRRLQRYMAVSNDADRTSSYNSHSFSSFASADESWEPPGLKISVGSRFAVFQPFQISPFENSHSKASSQSAHRRPTETRAAVPGCRLRTSRRSSTGHRLEWSVHSISVWFGQGTAVPMNERANAHHLHQDCRVSTNAGAAAGTERLVDGVTASTCLSFPLPLR
ncbi:hypothetical protein LX36DRAFT_170263 [Colletotrichum falcatum]|nr:hypothetical protein LX36DRAFT_170263 [Colletotrichum falcatum]